MAQKSALEERTSWALLSMAFLATRIAGYEAHQDPASVLTLLEQHKTAVQQLEELLQGVGLLPR